MGIMSRRIAALCLAMAAPVEAQTPAAPAVPGTNNDVSLLPGWQAEHFTPQSYVRFGHIAFKMTLAERGGRTFLYMGAPGGARPDGSNWEGFSVVDVTDPARPRIVGRVPIPLSSGQVTSDGRLLIVGHTRLGDRRGERPAGGTSPFFSIYDLADPARPVLLSTFSAAGNGTHRNTYPGGRYVYLSAELDGYRGNILQIVDIANPRRPREAGRYWLPGQAESEPEPAVREGFHGPLAVSADGRTATMGYAPSLINLDISDPAHPRLIGRVTFSPMDNRGMTTMHTGQPLFDGFTFVTTEPHHDGCRGSHANFSAMVDNSDPANPLLASYFPRPLPPASWNIRSFCDLPQWFGLHNINQEAHSPAVRGAGRLIFSTFFVAGVRAYDVSDPFMPREIAHFLPRNNDLQRGGADDIIADRRGNVYVSDSFGRGMWVLRYTGPDPDRAR